MFIYKYVPTNKYSYIYRLRGSFQMFMLKKKPQPEQS